MREILFRGKRIDNDEWVEGLLWKKKYNTDKLFISCFPDKDDNEEVFVVDKETVGQFTGLNDKNGKKIFEGDIVKEKDCIHNGKIQIKGDVFKIRFLDNGIFCADNGGWWEFIDEIGDIEIIGNIHDNPELLEVAK